MPTWVTPSTLTKAPPALRVRAPGSNTAGPILWTVGWWSPTLRHRHRHRHAAHVDERLPGMARRRRGPRLSLAVAGGRRTCRAG
jgi:hypothetical protein